MSIVNSLDNIIEKLPEIQDAKTGQTIEDKLDYISKQIDGSGSGGSRRIFNCEYAGEGAYYNIGSKTVAIMEGILVDCSYEDVRNAYESGEDCVMVPIGDGISPTYYYPSTMMNTTPVDPPDIGFSSFNLYKHSNTLNVTNSCISVHSDGTCTFCTLNDGVSITT